MLNNRMKKLLRFIVISFTLLSCHKNNTTPTGCDIQQVYKDNAKKVTITNGIWGTISSIEGDCMPPVSPSSSRCKNCPVKRTVMIYQYTLFTNATASAGLGGFYDNFSTPLVAQIDTDENGFFQISIPAGRYTIAIVENAKLYANGSDAQGGLNPFTFSTGTLNVNVAMTYKAAF